MNDDRAPDLRSTTVDKMLTLARDLGPSSDLSTTLSTYAHAITEIADFGCAVINLVNAEGDLEVVAVAGPPDLKAALSGTVGSRAGWDREIALAERHGDVHLSLGEGEGLDDLPTWVSDDESWFARTADDPQGWRPEYALYVPMYDEADGLVGVVSVDLPTSGMMPDQQQLTTLELLSRQAERAIVSTQSLMRTAVDESVFASVFESAGSAMCIADPTGRLTYVNRQFRDVFGAVAQVSAFDRLVTQVDGGDSLTGEVRAAFEGPVGERTFVVATGPPDQRAWFRVTVRGVGHQGGPPVRAVCTMVDVTSERRARHTVQHEEERDSLTGLFNRRGVRSAAAAIIGACMTGDLLVTMFCDLDGIRQVNDEHGHAVGDRLIVEIASALRVAAPEPAVIGRVGGDEFVIFATCSSIHEAEELADTIMRAGVVSSPSASEGPLTISVGIAMDDSEPRRTISDLMQAADEALHRAKLAGGGRWMSAPIP